MTTSERHKAYNEIAKALANKGFDVVNGFGKGGFWVRLANGEKAAFTNDQNFVSYRSMTKILPSIVGIDPETEKRQLIGFMIREAVASGKDVKVAVDSVLGLGTYDRIASDLYDALRSA